MHFYHPRGVAGAAGSSSFVPQTADPRVLGDLCAEENVRGDQVGTLRRLDTAENFSATGDREDRTETAETSLGAP